MKSAVYAGSFDPPTKGHYWMIKEGAKLFDHLTVAVAQNPEKKGTYHVEERVGMLNELTSHLPSVRVDHFSNEFTAKYAQRKDAGYLLRGIRSGTDYDEERTIAHINDDIAPGIKTIPLITPSQFEKISSSTVKGLIGPREWEKVVNEYVHAPVLNKLLLDNKGLQSRFRETAVNLSLISVSELYQELVGLYGSGRSYHTLAHVAKMLFDFDEVRELADNPGVIEAAIWYHDAIYDGSKPDNEERSANLAMERMHEAENEIIQKTGKLILASTHKEPTQDNDTQIFCDLDMLILASDEDEYGMYTTGIRKEYNMFSDDQFRAGRTAFLEKILTQKIFQHPHFNAKYEAKAKHNLEQELEKLKAA